MGEGRNRKWNWDGTGTGCSLCFCFCFCVSLYVEFLILKLVCSGGSCKWLCFQLIYCCCGPDEGVGRDRWIVCLFVMLLKFFDMLIWCCLLFGVHIISLLCC